MRLFITLAAALLATSAAGETPVLTVDVPDSFASEWGPGPAIEGAFEKICACDLQYRAGLQIARLKLEGTATPADIVMGISTDETAQARATGIFAPHGQDVSDLTLPFAWTDVEFLPFNWGHTAFIYDSTKLATPPHSFADLLDLPDDVKIVIQDPRTSSSGLALVLWVKAVYGAEAEAYWAALAPHILTVTASWAEAYGLFTDGEADMVFSYTTSPAYHMIVEKDDTKKAAIFTDGHYFNAELVGKVANSDQPELAAKFMTFILSETFQEMIPRVNFGLPVRLAPEKLPPEFARLNLPKKVLFLQDTEVEAMRGNAVAEWVRAMTQ